MSRVVRLPYKPNPGQLAFHRARHKARERALLVGTGGGKTVGAMYEVLDWCLEEPAGTAILGAPTVPMLKKVLYKAFEIVTGHPLNESHPLVESWNQSDRRLVLKNGWVWWFVSTLDPLSIEGPPECDLVYLTEGRVVRRFAGKDGAWSQMTRRLRGPPRRRGAILETHSPTAQIMDLWRTKSSQRVEVRGGAYEVHECHDARRMYWQWGLKDALAWGTIAKVDAEATLADYSGSDAEAVLEGRYARKTGAIYKQLARSTHSARVHKERIEWMSYGVDPGWRHLAFLTAHAWTGGSVATVDAFSGTEVDREGLITAAQALQDKWGEGTWWFGPDARSPELIKKFRDAGLDARAYAGGAGSVVDGIRELNTRLNRKTWQLVDDGENEHLQLLWQQLLDYEWDEAAAERGREEPVKEADDGPDSCLVAGTLVATSRGSVPIEAVQVGDYVETRRGLQRVSAAWLARRDADTVVASFSDGASLEGTPEHLVFVEGKGFTRLDALRYGDKICRLKPQRTTAEPTADNQAAATTNEPKPRLTHASSSTASSTKTTTAPSPQATRSTTATTTQATIAQKTSKPSPQANTPNATRIAPHRAPNNWPTWPRFDHWPPSGTPHHKAAHGIKPTAATSWPTAPRNSANASNATPPMRVGANPSFAPTPANPSIAAPNESTMKPGNANPATQPSTSTSTNPRLIAPADAVFFTHLRNGSRRDVYDLTVDEAEEYYANGILVHNCRYGILGGETSEPLGVW